MRNFSKIYKEDLDIVGRKAVELGELTRLGIPIPDGFVIPPSFFIEFLQLTGISKEIEEIQKLSHPAIADSILKLFQPIQKKIIHAHIPQNLAIEIHSHYRKLSGALKEQSLNIFTSPLKGKSFYFLDIKGDANLLLKIKEIWASQLHNPVAIVVTKNIKSKIKGKIITNDPLIDKKFVALAKKIQKHFYFPKDLNYVIVKDKIYITAMLPFTGKVEELPNKTVQNRRMQKVLIKGVSINPGIVTGPVKVLGENHDFTKILSGEIIVLPRLDMSTYRKIKKAKAIIIDDDLSSSYDRMLYRKDIKIPTIEGTKNAAKILQNGSVITVNGMNGEIYRGSLI